MVQDFQIEIHYYDRPVEWRPYIGTRDNAEKRIQAIVATGGESIDFVILLSGDYLPGTIASNHQILADTQSYPVEGAALISP